MMDLIFAGVRRLAREGDPDVIGPPDCPIMFRWTLFQRVGGIKVLFHQFLPNADDRDMHDHPWGFLTLVLSGSYDDLQPGGKVDRMRPGSVRYRSAHHTHRTRVGPDGCVTIVVCGRITRRWGFWREGQWWSRKRYEEAFGFGMRCDEVEAMKS